MRHGGDRGRDGNRSPPTRIERPHPCRRRVSGHHLCVLHDGDLRIPPRSAASTR